MVSSASTNYSVNEGDQTRKVHQHQFEENLQDGIKSTTFVKREEIVRKPSPQTVSYSQTQTVTQQQRSEPKQIFVQVDDQSGQKENVSPIPKTFQPHSASSPVQKFAVKNIKERLNVSSPTPNAPHQVIEQQAPMPYTPMPFTEHSTNIPMFRVSKFEAHKFLERPPPLENEYPMFDPSGYAPELEYPQVPQTGIPPAPPPPVVNVSDLHNATPDEQELFPVPRYTSEVMRQMSLQHVQRGMYDDSEEEDEDEHEGHLPIFAPPVQFTPDDRNLMDSGYDENLLTPGSHVERPHDLPDLDLHRRHSLDSDEGPGSPDTGSTSVRRKSK